MSKILRILASLAILVMAAGVVVTPTAPALAAEETYYTSGNSDGYARRYVAPPGATWASITSGNGVEAFSSNPGRIVYIGSTTTADQYSINARSFFFFNTAALPDAATITGATFSLYGQSKSDALGVAPDIVLMNTTSTNTAVAAADYQTIGATQLSDTTISYAGFSTAGYNDWTLNASGLAAISKTGYTRFAIATTYDTTGTPPTWASSKECTVYAYSDEAAGTSTDPKLVITYTLPTPTLTTSAATKIGNTVATGNGNITSLDGGGNVTSRGFEWDIDSGAPYANSVSEAGSFGTGAYTLQMIGLPDNTTIYYRAFAIGPYATGYGAEESFTTYDAPDGTTWPVNVVQDTAWAYGIGDIPQHHVFYAAGRHWVIYGSGPEGSYLFQARSSADGKTNWVTTNLTSSSYAFSTNLATAYDGTYFHIAIELAGTLYYRRGTFQSDGTLSWSAAWQAVANDIEGTANDPMDLAVDSTGHAFISYRTGAANKIVRNANTDGTWTMASGFPYTVIAAGGYASLLLPLDDGKVYALYTYTDVYGRLWNGTTWGDQETITLDNLPWVYVSLSATSHGDVVEAVYLGSDNITHAATRSASGAWTTTSITGAISANANPLLTLWGDDDLRVFYVNNNRIYGLSRVDDEWDTSAIELVNESTRTIQEPWAELSVAYNSASVVGDSNQVGISYIVGTDPYDVRYFVFSDVGVQTDAATNVDTDGMTLNGQITGVSGDNATNRGFEWGWTSGIYQNSWTEAGSFGVGAFSHDLTGYFDGEGFYEGEIVYFRAIAITPLGISRGGEQTTATTTIPVRYPFDVEIQVDQDTPTAWPQVPIMADVNNVVLANQTVVLATTRDTQVSDMSVFPHMTTDNRTIFSLSVPASNDYAVNYSSGNTPTDRFVIPGYGGNVTTLDNAALEMGDNFTLLMSIYVDVTGSANYTRKDSAIIVSNTSGNITASITGGASVSHNVTSSGEYVVKLTADTTDLDLYIDDTLEDTAALGGVGVPDTGDSYVWLEGVPYARYLAIKVNNSWALWYQPRLMITGTTLPDRMSTEDGAIAFGANPAGFTVSLGSIESQVAPRTPTAPTSSWELVPPGATSTPEGLFSEGGEGMPGLKEMADAMEDTGNPRELGPGLFAFAMALLAGLAVFGMTHNTKVGQRGSLLLQSITSLAVMVIFYIGGDGVIPGWVLIPFGLEALFWLLTRNPQHSAT